MSYKSPLGRVMLRTGRIKEYRGDCIPEYITLPDGREVALRDLIGKVKNRISIDARNPKASLERKVYYKYTDEDRIWIAEHTIEQVVERYKVTPNYAKLLIGECQRRFKNLPPRPSNHTIIYSDD